MWLPNNDSPGLAMARAFGDFCLKDYGLISVPDVSYRHLTDKDEFIILATDGVCSLRSDCLDLAAFIKIFPQSAILNKSVSTSSLMEILIAELFLILMLVPFFLAVFFPSKWVFLQNYFLEIILL